MRTLTGIGVFLLALVFLTSTTNAAPAKNKNKKTAHNLPKVNADVLPAGQFTGVLASPPNSDRMITLKITYSEMRLKPGAKMPKPRGTYARGMRRMGRGSGGRNMYQVVQTTREVDFQLNQNVKVRVKEVPAQFDEKGNIKNYTKEELAILKGKDKNLIGYESSMEALQPGQTILLSLRTHRKTRPTTPAAKKDKDIDKETDAALEHKMQVTVLVILKDADASQNAKAKGKGKGKKKKK